MTRFLRTKGGEPINAESDRADLGTEGLPLAAPYSWIARKTSEAVPGLPRHRKQASVNECREFPTPRR